MSLWASNIDAAGPPNLLAEVQCTQRSWHLAFFAVSIARIFSLSRLFELIDKGVLIYVDEDAVERLKKAVPQQLLTPQEMRELPELVSAIDLACSS